MRLDDGPLLLGGGSESPKAANMLDRAPVGQVSRLSVTSPENWREAGRLSYFGCGPAHRMKHGLPSASDAEQVFVPAEKNLPLAEGGRGEGFFT
jgi:hypothetical protein